jgi:hypothetical protein
MGPGFTAGVSLVSNGRAVFSAVAQKALAGVTRPFKPK